MSTCAHPLRKAAAIGAVLLLCARPGAVAQGISIGEADMPPHASALLQLLEPAAADRKQGFYPPNVQLTRTDDATPVGPLPLPDGLVVFNTATSSLTGVDAQYNVYPGFYFWEAAGSRWLRFEAGVGRHIYVDCSSTTAADFKEVQYQATWATTTNAAAIPGLQTAGSIVALQAGDRVVLEASGAFRLDPLAGDEDRYTDVEVELVYNTGNGTTWTVPSGGVLARTVVSLDARARSGGSNSFFFGLFSSSTTGFTQRMSVQNWSLQAVFDVPTSSTSNTTMYKFWVRARKVRNITGQVQTGLATSVPADRSLQGCLRTEIFRY